MRAVVQHQLLLDYNHLLLIKVFWRSCIRYTLYRQHMVKITKRTLLNLKVRWAFVPISRQLLLFHNRTVFFSTRTEKAFVIFPLESLCWESFKARFSLQKRPKDIPWVLQLRQTLQKHLGDGCVFRLANLNSWCTEKKANPCTCYDYTFHVALLKAFKVYFQIITVNDACLVLSDCSSGVLKHLPQHVVSNRWQKIGRNAARKIRGSLSAWTYYIWTPSWKFHPNMHNFISGQYVYG